MTIGPDALRRLVPHGGTMCLLDTVEAWDGETIVCSTLQHRSPTNPLRGALGLSSVHAIELAAQATAVHGALAEPAGAGPAFGMLASVRHCCFHCATLDDVEGALCVEARRVAGSEELVVYEFAVDGAGRRLVDGRVGIFRGRLQGS